MKRKWILWLIIPLCVMIIAAAAGYLYLQQNRYDLTMSLEGQSALAVELGQTFTDPGAQATGQDWLTGESAVDVVCTGNVDTGAVGVYRLGYRAQFHDKICTAYRDVHVVESLAPVITLVSDPNGYTLPNETYQEEGFSATDWYDGDLTAMVQSKEENGIITYSVTNSAGLTTSVERPIRYDDPIAPTLTLVGDAEMTVQGGKPFEDPGCHAFDNADGDLTEFVQTTGLVDMYRPGTYTLTYAVTDRWGNTSSITRDVTVEINLTNQYGSGSKIIYLTFDDGPGAHTARLLDILDKYDVKATFFLINSGAVSIAQQMADRGHTVAIHSATHNYSRIYASEEAFFSDLYQMQEILAEYIGEPTYLMRFPGGSSNTVSSKYNKGIMTRLTKAVREAGFCYFDWNVDSNDAGGAKTAEEVFQNVTTGVAKQNTAVVLQHDIYDFSVDAVERIIVWGLANGYTFLPLTAGSPTFAHGVNN